MTRKERLLSTADAANRLAEAGLDTTEETVREWARTGKLRAVRTPGGRFKFDPVDVDAVLQPTKLRES